jgi:hypothetical protein
MLSSVFTLRLLESFLLAVKLLGGGIDFGIDY